MTEGIIRLIIAIASAIIIIAGTVYFMVELRHSINKQLGLVKRNK